MTMDASEGEGIVFRIGPLHVVGMTLAFWFLAMTDETGKALTP
jgi:hypothetical protein